MEKAVKRAFSKLPAAAARWGKRKAFEKIGRHERGSCVILDSLCLPGRLYARVSGSHACCINIFALFGEAGDIEPMPVQLERACLLAAVREEADGEEGEVEGG